MVVVTVNSLDGKSAQDYADDFYDYNGYGIGTDKSGILLLVSMEARDWHITTTGFGIRAITDAGLDYISDQFLPYLSDGEYLDAFETYAICAMNFLRRRKPGMHMTEIICLRCVSLVEKSADRTWKWRCDRTADRGRYEKKSEKCKNAAFGRKLCQSGKYSGDKTAGSFLYTRTSKSARPKNNSGSSGSSTHTSSSGTSHGGGGGKFKGKI